MKLADDRLARAIRLYRARHVYPGDGSYLVQTFKRTEQHERKTLDGGKPVSPYTVMEEMGHRDLSLIERVYGHLQAERQRLPVVEYREATVTELKQARGARWHRFCQREYGGKLRS